MKNYKTALLLIALIAVLALTACGVQLQSPVVTVPVEQQVVQKCDTSPRPVSVTVGGNTYACSSNAPASVDPAAPAANVPSGNDGAGLQQSDNTGCPFHTSADWQSVSGQPLVPDSGEACMGSYNSKGQAAVDMTCPDGYVCTVHETDGIHLRLGPGNFTSTDFTVRKLYDSNGELLYPEGLCGIRDGEMRQAEYVGYQLIVDDAITAQCQ